MSHGNAKDYTLEKHGMIILTRPTSKRRNRSVIWEGLCECGKVVEREPLKLKQSVKEGNIPNCGCHLHNRKDYTGQKFGKLIAVKPTLKQRNLSIIWEFICCCGRVVERVPTGLAHTVEIGGNPNCGCLKRLPKLPKGEAARNALLQSYIYSARVRGLEWSLLDDEAFILFEGACYCCGAPPATIKKAKRANGRFATFVYNGIDRVNNDEGYTLSNSVSCCGRCNGIKLEMTLDELKIHIKKMHDHLFT